MLTNIHGDADWDHCFVVPNVDLPTGYYLGMSAATGDLAGDLANPMVWQWSNFNHSSPSLPDNHDIISVKTYDMGGPRAAEGTMAEV